MTANMMPVSAARYSNLYLEPALLMAIYNANMKDTEPLDWICQYAQTNYQGNLIYKNGYVRLFDEFTQPGQLDTYFEKQLLEYGGDFIQTVIEHIDQKRYVMFEADEFYLEHAYFFNRSHYFRKFLVYGYDRDEKVLFTLTHNKATQLVPVPLSFSTVNFLIYHRPDDGSGINRDWQCARSIRHRKNVHSRPVFTNCWSRYCRETEIVTTDGQGRPVVKRTYGQQGIYTVIEDALKKKAENLEVIDYRCFAILAVQKQMIAKSLDRQARETRKDCFASLANEYRKLSKRVRLLALYMVKEFGGAPVMPPIMGELGEIRKWESDLIQAVTREAGETE